MKSHTPISKSLFFFLFLSLFINHYSFLSAQAPKEFSYQAVARNGSAVLDNATIDVRFDILQGGSQGTSVWNEIHTNVTTNALGLFSVKVGSVTTFTVDWTAGPYFLNVQVDLQDGSGLRDFGNAELLSVPYALFAQEGNEGPRVHRELRGLKAPLDRKETREFREYRGQLAHREKWDQQVLPERV